MQNPTYIYNTAGTYTVSLTVSNSAGADSMTKADFITASSAAGPQVHITESAYDYPETALYRASFSMDVTGPSSPAGWLKYYYTRTRMNFASTQITEMVTSAGTTTIHGTGTVNGIGGYTFTATVSDSAPDSFGITIRRSDGSTFYTAGPGTISGGDLMVSTP